MIAEPKKTPLNFGTYQFKAIPPDGQAGQLSAGKYSLSSLSTVPYATLVGMEGREKLFSWGELIEIPEGRIVTVRNSSAHTGDIIINGGWDYSNAPRRVTVPVPSTVTAFGAGSQIRPSFFVDTRRAIRAWYVVNVSDVGDLNGTSQVTGIFGTHSSLSFDSIAPFFGGGTGFNTGNTLLATQAYCFFPLGFCAKIEDCTCPMVLADKGTTIITLPSAAAVFDADATPSFYLLEY